MKRYRYITDPNATRITPANTIHLLANNQVPADINICFRIKIDKTTDTKSHAGYSTTHDPRRLEEMHLCLRIRNGAKWETIALQPNDMRTLKDITTDIENE